MSPAAARGRSCRCDTDCLRRDQETAELSVSGYCLIRKSTFVSLVPFISSRIQIGNMPRPDHFRPLVFLLWYFGLALARVPVFGTCMTVRTTFAAFCET